MGTRKGQPGWRDGHQQQHGQQSPARWRARLVRMDDKSHRQGAAPLRTGCQYPEKGCSQDRRCWRVEGEPGPHHILGEKRKAEIGIPKTSETRSEMTFHVMGSSKRAVRMTKNKTTQLKNGIQTNKAHD